MEVNYIKIILANDHTLLLNGIRQALLNDASLIEIVGEALDFEALLILLHDIEADILMTDDVMPGGTILTILPLIKTQYPHLKIIVISMHESLNPISIAVMDSVQGWLKYEATAEQFIKAIKVVNAGSTFYGIDK